MKLLILGGSGQLSGRLVAVSTDSVYDPFHKQVPQVEEASYYMKDDSCGANKRRMEEALFSRADAGLAITVFRPGHIFGPGFLPGCYQEHFRQKDLLQHIRADKPLRLAGRSGLTNPAVACIMILSGL